MAIEKIDTADIGDAKTLEIAEKVNALIDASGQAAPAAAAPAKDGAPANQGA